MKFWDSGDRMNVLLLNKINMSFILAFSNFAHPFLNYQRVTCPLYSVADSLYRVKFHLCHSTRASMTNA